MFARVYHTCYFAAKGSGSTCSYAFTLKSSPWEQSIYLPCRKEQGDGRRLLKGFIAYLKKTPTVCMVFSSKDFFQKLN